MAGDGVAEMPDRCGQSQVARMVTAGTSVLRAPSMPIVTIIEEVEDYS